MVASWNQPCCEACWIEQEATWDTDEAEGFDYITSIRQPTVLMMDHRSVERCSWCGKPTIMGIFKREDPSKVPFPAKEDDG